MSVLLYAAETWTLLSGDEKTLEAFHMKCQRQILHIHWSRHVTDTEISARTGLPPVMDFIRRRRLSVFGHIARHTQGTPAHNALHCQVGRGIWSFTCQGLKFRSLSVSFDDFKRTLKTTLFARYYCTQRNRDAVHNVALYEFLILFYSVSILSW